MMKIEKLVDTEKKSQTDTYLFRNYSNHDVTWTFEDQSGVIAPSTADFVPVGAKCTGYYNSSDDVTPAGTIQDLHVTAESDTGNGPLRRYGDYDNVYYLRKCKYQFVFYMPARESGVVIPYSLPSPYHVKFNTSCFCSLVLYGVPACSFEQI